MRLHTPSASTQTIDRRCHGVWPARRAGNRGGFTIVELLIVVSILLLLTTFTVIAVDFTFEAERVSSAARQVQSMLSGARDRAIRARKAIGVRLVVDQDPDNGRTVSSMIYVGETEHYSLGHITLKRLDLNDDGVVDGGDTRILIVEGDEQTRWEKLRLRGLLGVYEDRNGNDILDPGEDANGNGVLDRETPRIKIPGDKNGTWYQVRTDLLGNTLYPPGAVRRSLFLVREFRDPGTTSPTDVIAFEGSGYSTYQLELPPRVLSDADPVLLPEGVVIDLDGSSIPTGWRPAAGGHAIPCSSRMDLMFSPRGTIVGTPAGLGMLHFYICRRSDIQLVADAGRAPVNGTAQPIVPGPAMIEDKNGNGTRDAGEPDLNGNGLLDEVTIGDRSLVSVFTSTGKVASYPINPRDGEDLNGNGVLDPGEDFNNNGTLELANGALDDPFLYAELGESNSQ
jgi:prepilin-type N-terminal cleavage/methylation domain-containing protein